MFLELYRLAGSVAVFVELYGLQTPGSWRQTDTGILLHFSVVEEYCSATRSKDLLLLVGALPADNLPDFCKTGNVVGKVLVRVVCLYLQPVAQNFRKLLNFVL